MRRSSLIFAHIALSLVAVFYALNYFLAKGVFSYIPPLGVLVFRNVFAFLIFFLICRVWIKEKIQSRKDWGRLLGCAVFGSILNQIFFYTGLDQTIEVNAAVLMITTPLFVFLLAVLMKTESIKLRQIVGLAISFGGAALLSLSGRSLEMGSDTLIGDLLVLVNAASYGMYLVLVRPLVLKYHPLTVVCWLFFFSAIVHSLLGFPDLLTVSWEQIPVQVWWSIVYIILFATVGTYGLNAFGLQRLPSSAVGIYIYLQPVLVTAFGVLFFGKNISLLSLVYMLLVMLGVALVAYEKRTN
ncbi:MAG: DMT family transporter [Bacteroidota bacterium]